MIPPVRHILHEQNFWLSHQRCMWWEEENILIVADLHLGKTGHFRKSGIAIPAAVYLHDLQRLTDVLTHFGAGRLLIIGDMSHSAGNRELEHFLKWRRDMPGLQIDLVRGNHDILEEKWYQEAEIEVHEDQMSIQKFCFVHEKVAEAPKNSHDDFFTFSGHLHPGITLKGPARQALRLPCFYFSQNHCILPAFSHFTGTYRVQPRKNETVYAILQSGLVKM